MPEPFVQGHVRRHFVEYDHPEGKFTLKAHVVTDKTKGEVSVPGGGSQVVQTGQVLIETDRPGTYEVHEGNAFDEFGLEPVTDQVDLGEDEDTADEEPLYDPSEHTAAEVRRYLRNPNLDTAERDRVVSAERSGENRASAIPTGL